jgi:hypothetical protein
MVMDWHRTMKIAIGIWVMATKPVFGLPLPSDVTFLLINFLVLVGLVWLRLP